MDLQEILKGVFTATDENLLRFNANSANDGTFFSSQRVPLTIKPDRRVNGVWTAEGDLSALYVNTVGVITVSLIPDMTKIGFIIPNAIINELVAYDYELIQHLSTAFNGKTPDIIRDMGDKTLFDYIFSGGVYSAEWLLQCGEISPKGKLAMAILAYTLAGKIIFMWDSLCKTLFNAGSVIMTDWVITTKGLKSLPQAIFTDAAVTIMNSNITGGEAWHMVKTSLDDAEFCARIDKLLSDVGEYALKKVNPFLDA